MANRIDGRQWVLDSNTGSGPIPNSPARVWVAGMRWRDYASAADQVVVVDGARNLTVEHLKGRSDLLPVDLNYVHPQQIRLFSLPIITSGILEVYVK